MESRTLIRKLSSGAVAALIFALFAFGASLIINRNVFETVPHLEDEFAYLYQAKIFARGQTWVPRNEPVKVFWQPFVLQPETSPDGTLRRFGKYTPGWPLLLAPGAANETPWVTNAFMAMFNVLLVYRLGRDLFGEAVGVVGAALMAISPMALILNATLMSHPSALTFTMLFVYAYYRTTRDKRPLRQLILWGLVGGTALGLLVSMRPLTALAMAAPVGLHALSRLFDVFTPEKKLSFGKFALPLIVMGVFVLPWIGLIFGFNYAVTGEVRSELYTLLWSYDKPGFGEGTGTLDGGHSLTYAWRNFNADITVWSRDLLGITLNPTVDSYLSKNLGYGAGVGLAWLFVAVGLVAGRKNEWIWLLFELFMAIVIAQLTYWIGSAVYGSAVYSVRYYYEATGGIMLVIAYGLVTQARAWSPKAEQVSGAFRRAWARVWPGYVLLTVLILASLIGYLPARLSESLPGWPNGLYGFNKVGRYQLRDLDRLREPGRQMLIIVLRDPNPTIEDDWRNYGAYMAETSPFLDSDIIVARFFDPDGVDEFKQRFSGRQVLYQVGERLYPTLEAALRKPPATTRDSSTPDSSISGDNAAPATPIPDDPKVDL